MDPPRGQKYATANMQLQHKLELKQVLRGMELDLQQQQQPDGAQILLFANHRQQLHLPNTLDCLHIYICIYIYIHIYFHMGPL